MAQARGCPRIARNASLLILDEPTASLSVQAEYELLAAFTSCHKDGQRF